MASKKAGLLVPCLALLPFALIPKSAWKSDSKAAADPVLRIGLIRAFARPASVTVTTSLGARLVDDSDATVATGPAEWRFRVKEGRVTVEKGEDEPVAASSFRIEPGEVGKPVGITSSHRVKPRHYRGALEICPNGSGLRIVNTLPLESYLRGVIAAEMPSSAAPDALCAQTIAARTFALKSRGRYRAQGYDLSDSTDCQMYDGVEAETTATDASVRDTAGLILTRDGQMILADFYDDCGGVTSAGDGKDDYPPSVVDAPGEGGPDYCARGAYHTWSLTVSAEELGRSLGTTEESRIGALHDIQVKEKDASGRARKLVIVGEKGAKEIAAYLFRGRLGYERLRSTLFTLSRGEKGEFIFQGRGWGHGHGLCQWGAMGMAAAPYRRSYREILTHYFPGASVETFREQEIGDGRR